MQSGAVIDLASLEITDKVGTVIGTGPHSLWSD